MVQHYSKVPSTITIIAELQCLQMHQTDSIPDFAWYFVGNQSGTTINVDRQKDSTIAGILLPSSYLAKCHIDSIHTFTTGGIIGTIVAFIIGPSTAVAEASHSKTSDQV